jgi:hypothetical protein
MMMMGSVGLYTDMEHINFDDVLGQGGILFIRHFNPNLALGVGPVLTTAFGFQWFCPGFISTGKRMEESSLNSIFRKVQKQDMNSQRLLLKSSRESQRNVGRKK